MTGIRSNVEADDLGASAIIPRRWLISARTMLLVAAL